jgi:hypothetical protein
MTPAESFQTEVYSLERAISLDGHHHVFGAGGIKTAATGEKGGNEHLVEYD